jgi:outer membrane receptor protein involved in Fe transport
MKMPKLAKRSCVCVFQSQFAGFKTACGLVVCLMALCICVSPALAQSASTGALAGTVTDPSGAVISGATVTATSLATGQTRTTTTDANGLYKFSLLPPGNYNVKISAMGFKTAEVPSIAVNVTETPTLNRSLEIGATTQEVTVSSTAETIQTQNATVGGLVGGQTVTTLPLSTRNYTQVIDLSPGVVANVATATAVGNGTQDINVNGSGSDQNTYMMDGAVITNYGSGGAAQSGSYAGIGIPNPDSIQEFKVQTSQYDAAYGQHPGAKVNVVTKSGTNQFHGGLWEFNRNNFFNANDFFYKHSEIGAGLPNKPPELKQNQFGGTFGGPIKKDKLFFFGSYQGTRQLNGLGSNGFATGITAVSLLPFNEPGVAFANARSDGNVGSIHEDFVAANPMCSYSTYKQYLGCAFANEFDLLHSVVPLGFGTGASVAPDGSNISNTFVNLLRQTENIPQVKGGFNNGYYVPSVNYVTDGSGDLVPVCIAKGVPCSGLTTISQATEANEDQYLINTDYVISNKHTFSEKYFFSSDPQTQSFSCLGGCYPGAPENAHYGSQSLVTKLTSVLTSNLVNEAFFSFQRLYLNVVDGVTVTSCEGDGTTPLNIIPAINNGVGGAGSAPCTTNPVANFEDKLVPVIGSFGFPGSQWGPWQLGGNFFSATHSLQNTFLGNEQISWNHGKHSIRAGFNIQRIQWNWSQPDRERGWIDGGNIADLMTSSSGVAADGTPFVPNGIFLNLTNRLLPPGSPNPHHWRVNEYSSFVQDDIKLTRRLTVNAGLRWEFDGWPSDNAGVFTNFAASAAGLIDSGSFFVNNPTGTLAGYIVQSNYNKAFYNGLTGEFGTTGILVNSNKTLMHRPPIDNFSPRVGLAWQATEKLVVRAGYGMFFDRVYGNLLGDNILGNQPPYATGIGTNPGESLQNPFCAPGTCPQFLGFIPRTLQVVAGDPINGATAITDINGGNGTGLITSGDNPAMRTPKVQQYNLDVQYEFAHGWVADVGYVGTHGIHLFDWNREPNLAYLVAGAPDPPTDKVNQLLERPASSFAMNDAGNTDSSTQVLTNTAPGIGSIGNVMGRVAYLGVAPSGLQQVETDGAHLYNSLQAQLRHNFANGLMIQASYTWSKLITDVNASEAGGGIATPGNVLSGSASSNDPLNVRQQYGLAAFNRPQRFVVNYSYDLPYKGEGWHEKVLGGWSVSGVTTLQDGSPFTVIDGAGPTLLYGSSIATGANVRAELANPGACNSFGTCKSTVPLGTSGGIESRLGGSFGGPGFINQGAFVAAPAFGGTPSTNPGPYTGNCGGANPEFIGCGTGFGDSGVGVMSCCTQFNFDMGIIKNTKVGGIREDANLQFRAEFYNLFNHAQFNPPVNDRNSANFGTINSSAVPGRILQFGLKYTF